MKLAFLNRAGRVVAMVVLLGSVMLIAGYFGGRLDPKAEGWLLAGLTAIFLVSEAFFWRAMDGVSDLPTSDALDAQEASLLFERVQALKSRLVKRWFILFFLKVIAGICAAFLTNQSTPGGPQPLLWILGIAALTLSLPLALSFLRNWQQADRIKVKQFLDAKRRLEQREAIAQLSALPANALNADEALSNYTKLVSNQESASVEP